MRATGKRLFHSEDERQPARQGEKEAAQHLLAGQLRRTAVDGVTLAVDLRGTLHEQEVAQGHEMTLIRLGRRGDRGRIKGFI